MWVAHRIFTNSLRFSGFQYGGERQQFGNNFMKNTLSGDGHLILTAFCFHGHSCSLEGVDVKPLNARQLLPHNCRGHRLQQLRGLFSLIIKRTAVVATRAVDGAERLFTAARKRRQIQLLLTAIVFATTRHLPRGFYRGLRAQF